MMIGTQRPAQLEAQQIADAHARLQKRMEDDPRVPSMQPGGQAVIPGLTDVPAPAPAFVYGQGGARISPEDLAYRRRLNDQQLAAGMDFSPVQSWTQGAARVAQALIAGSERRKLDQLSQANTNARDVILRELTKGSPSQDAVTTALSDTDPAVREMGERVWALQHPKPLGPSDLQQRVEYLNSSRPGLGDTYAQNYAANGGGAPQFVTTPQGTFMVPRSAAATPAAPAGVPDAAVAYLRSNPDSAAQFDAKYGAGASSRYLQGGTAPQASAPFATR